MKIKFRNQIIDASNEPIMLILDHQDKINIKNMTPEATKYCSYPNTYSSDEIRKFMKMEDVFNPTDIKVNSNQTPKHVEVFYDGLLDEEQAIEFAKQNHPWLEGIIVFNMPKHSLNSSLTSGLVVIQ